MWDDINLTWPTLKYEFFWSEPYSQIIFSIHKFDIFLILNRILSIILTYIRMFIRQQSNRTNINTIRRYSKAVFLILTITMHIHIRFRNCQYWNTEVILKIPNFHSSRIRLCYFISVLLISCSSVSGIKMSICNFKVIWSADNKLIWKPILY